MKIFDTPRSAFEIENINDLGIRALKMISEDAEKSSCKIQCLPSPDAKTLLIGKLVSAILTLEAKVNDLEQQLSYVGRNP